MLGDLLGALGFLGRALLELGNLVLEPLGGFLTRARFGLAREPFDEPVEPALDLRQFGLGPDPLLDLFGDPSFAPARLASSASRRALADRSRAPSSRAALDRPAPCGGRPSASFASAAASAWPRTPSAARSASSRARPSACAFSLPAAARSLSSARLRSSSRASATSVSASAAGLPMGLRDPFGNPGLGGDNALVRIAHRLVDPLLDLAFDALRLGLGLVGTAVVVGELDAQAADIRGELRDAVGAGLLGGGGYVLGQLACLGRGARNLLLGLDRAQARLRPRGPTPPLR